MNEKVTPKTKLPGNLNKAELALLNEISPEKLVSKLRKELKNTSEKNPHKKETLMDKINFVKNNFGSNEGKGGMGNFVPKGIKKMPTVSREMAKGGEVKKYMGGGSVNKNKKNMITTKGWGASRKT